MSGGPRDKSQPIVNSFGIGQQRTDDTTLITRGKSSAIPFSSQSDSSALLPPTKNSETRRVVPLKWFEILARDISRSLGSTKAEQNPTCDSDSLQHTSSQKVGVHEPRLLGTEPRAVFGAPDRGATTEDRPSSPISWTSENQISLSDLEKYLFRHFVHALGTQLYFHDSEMQFSTAIPHLALRNLGLLKALLALSTRHLSLGVIEKANITHSLSKYEIVPSDQETGIDHNLAVEYYNECLCYLNQAMQDPFYTQSLDFLATAIIISTYEMIDGGIENWGRHIQGMSWIQQYQGNDGESGGLRYAVWWAWLQQDIWIAMRERRPVYNKWAPTKHISTLTAPDLTRHILYLLSECVNYASDAEKQDNLLRRSSQGAELVCRLQEWRSLLPLEYSPLPSVSNSQIFPTIWVYPPPYAAALQIQSLALIIVILHQPSSPTDGAYQEARHVLAASVSTICGIARSIEAENHGANLVSLNCLFGGET